MSVNLTSKIQFLKGVGPVRAERLQRLGVETVEDLLAHFPFRWEDRTGFESLGRLEIGKTVVVRGRVQVVKEFGRKWRKGIRVAVSDGTGTLVGTWFQTRYVRDRFKPGQEVVFHGTVGEYRNELTMTHPDFEVLDETDEISSLSLNRIVPVYPATEGLSPALIRAMVHRALEEAGQHVPEWLPPCVLKHGAFLPPPEAFKEIHFPSSAQRRDQAVTRFKFEELFLLQVLLALRRHHVLLSPKSVASRMWPRLDERIRRRLPFTPTAAQERAIADVTADMTSPHPMNRLLEGDVGSGKTAVAVYALLTAIANKGQAAFMAPTEVLAEQHYLLLQKLLAGSEVRVALLEGGVSPGARKALLEQIAAGEVDLVVGTHALIQKDVRFQRLGLVVVDEQHKFGVAQRARILEKGANPDFLVMTATPIPRTLTLTLFGDLDLSVLDEMPPGRIPSVTRWIRSKRSRPKTLRHIHEQLALGRQAFFVYPAIEESESHDLSALETEVEVLRNEIFPEFTVGLLHGRLTRSEKERVMGEFRKGTIQVLAATTVIEVGVDVPNATVMAVESADRFGLAQLHQLRGRIGRGGGESFCYLFGRAGTPEAKMRLTAIEASSDGFELAEEDLRIRGPGEFSGEKQHGLPEFRLANIVEDEALLRTARDLAFDLVASDPALDEVENQALAQRLARKTRGGAGWVGVG